MSRIAKYQESVNKQLKKVVIGKNDIDNIDIITQHLSLCDHLTSILLLTVLNNRSKKKNLKINGYPMACGIDLMMMICSMTDNKNHYEENIGKERYKNVISELTIMIYKSLSENIESIKYVNSKDYESTNKTIISSLNYLNKKIYDITKIEEFVSNKKISKNEISTINFGDKDLIKSKLLKLCKIDRVNLEKYVEKKYGYIAQCALVMGWLLGGGDEKMIDSLEKIGLNFGYILKICYDFKNIEFDIKNSNKVSTNLLINLGIHDTFGLFMEKKSKFIEGCLVLDIYTTTTKEMLDLLEMHINECVEKSNLDLKSTYSSFSSM